MSASKLPTAERKPTGDLGGTLGRWGPTATGPVVLERYRLHRRLGSGAFGTVWQAHDERLEREVAVKIVARERIVGGRFEREARTAARLSHPGIVTLYEAGADDEGAYLVSELVRGVTLAELLDAGRLSDRDIVEIGVALCDALAHAHSQGVVHRDVKPSNVLVPERPATPAEVAKLTDFGVARVVGGDSLTQTGDVIGTDAYMAPEQAEGRDVGAGADLYALALVLYEALTGCNPVRTGSAAQRARRLGAHLPPLRRQRRELPRELGQGIDLALRPRPRERGSIATLRSALAASLGALSDNPGVVTSPWPAGAQLRGEDSAADHLDQPTPELQAGRREALDGLEEPAFDGPPARTPWLPRVLAAAAVAGLSVWLVSSVLRPAPIAPLAIALGAAALVALLPRLGWIALTLTLGACMLLQDRAGGALALAVAALIPVLVLPRTGWAWPLPAAAPALGALGLAGAWPALAARASNPWCRAALGFTGWLWLVIAESLAPSRLYLGSATGTPAAGLWTRSLHSTLHDVLGPMLSKGMFAPAIVWAFAAVVLPWLVRGRSGALDLARVVAWAVALALTTSASIALASGTAAHSMPRGAVLGALVGAAVALVPTVLHRRRIRDELRPAQARLP